MNTASILGVQFHAVTKQQAVELAMSKIRSRQKGYVVTPNPEIVDLCRHDEKFMGVVNHATLVLPDGIGIIYAAKILGEKLQGKVAGIEFAESLVAAMAKENMRLYLLGAKPGVAEKAGANLCAKYPGLVIAGTHDGYFSDPQEVVDSINAAGGADVVFVCLGAPKQEKIYTRTTWTISTAHCSAVSAARWMCLQALPSARRIFSSSWAWSGFTVCSSSPAVSAA